MTYNGWTNVRTWDAYNFISSREAWWDTACRVVTENILDEWAADDLRGRFEGIVPDREDNTINWLEIVASIRESADPLWSLCTDDENDRKAAAEIIAGRTMLSPLWLWSNLPEGLCFGEDWEKFEQWLKEIVE